jgi:hydrogenase maturation protease
MTLPQKWLLAIVGVGNTLAGDDGVGIEVIRRLRLTPGTDRNVLLHTLEGDHFEIADILHRAERFIFVDAVEGERPGELVCMENTRRAFAPSLHQTDIATVMHSLEAFGIADPFPSWEIWGVTILPPPELGEGLSPEVAESVGLLCEKLCGVIEETVKR